MTWRGFQCGSRTRWRKVLALDSLRNWALSTMVGFLVIMRSWVGGGEVGVKAGGGNDASGWNLDA